MTRRESREHLIKLLYLRDYHDPEELEEQYDLYFELYDVEAKQKLAAGDREEIMERFGKVVEKMPEIDARIMKASKGWKLDRIGKVELGILRLAVYEIDFDETIPAKVSVNEAVELAKSYCGSQSSSFVNGILAKII